MPIVKAPVRLCFFGLPPCGLFEAGLSGRSPFWPGLARTKSEALDQGSDQGGRQGGEQEGVEDAVADLLDEEGNVHGVHGGSPLALNEGAFYPSIGDPLH